MWQKMWDKTKKFGVVVMNALEEIGKRRAQRAISYELQHYYRYEYGEKFMKNYPYGVLTSKRD